jgi:hypothetical protein
METDSTIGKRVQHVRYQTTDNTAASLSLSFPDAFNVNTNNHFPMEFYTEMTLRIAAVSMSQNSNIFSVWSPYIIGGPGYSYGFEQDYMEVQPNSQSGGTWIYGDGGIEWDDVDS